MLWIYGKWSFPNVPLTYGAKFLVALRWTNFGRWAKLMRKSSTINLPPFIVSFKLQTKNVIWMITMNHGHFIPFPINPLTISWKWNKMYIDWFRLLLASSLLTTITLIIMQSGSSSRRITISEEMKKEIVSKEYLVINEISA